MLHPAFFFFYRLELLSGGTHLKASLSRCQTERKSSRNPTTGGVYNYCPFLLRHIDGSKIAFSCSGLRDFDIYQSVVGIQEDNVGNSFVSLGSCRRRIGQAVTTIVGLVTDVDSPAPHPQIFVRKIMLCFFQLFTRHVHLVHVTCFRRVF